MTTEHHATETCLSFIHKNLRIEAQVTIKPKVIIGDGYKVECCDIHPCSEDEKSSYPRFGLNKYLSKEKKPEEPCKFTVKQDLCIKIPLVFSAETTVVPKEVICDTEEKDD
ncbi:hypothetical protein [Jeotgalibacillus aurantiacus]|uniref:hypothetical protein n=1 Tax=Jeotgalibacillus aurantiacus TaxID=2763266 RepID=UPI001D09E400|nr:hypothetical protein [Jeotgalibacillus aurantiacus]